MKKILTILALLFVAGLTASAQSQGESNTARFSYLPYCFEAAPSTAGDPANSQSYDACIKRNSAGVFKFTIGDLSTAAPIIASTLTLNAATDGYFVVPAQACSWKTSGTVGTTNNTIVADGASFTPVLQGSATSAAPSNNSLVCNIVIPSRLTASKGVTITDITVAYGVQTTALTSLGAPAISTITFPVAGTAETASTVTPVAISGALTVTPVVGSANLGLTTAGAYFTEKVALGTPLALTSDLTLVLFSQVFAQSASAAQLVSTPGLLVHYNLPTIY